MRENLGLMLPESPKTERDVRGCTNMDVRGRRTGDVVVVADGDIADPHIDAAGPEIKARRDCFAVP